MKMFSVVIAMIACTLAVAGEVNIQWQETPGAINYKVTAGQSEITLDWDSDGVVINVPDGEPVCFTVQACNGTGCSGTSREICGYPDPEITAIVASCDNIPEGGVACTLAVAGENFGPGLGVAITYPGVEVLTVHRLDSRSVEVEMTIAPDATGGSADLLLLQHWRVTEGTALENDTAPTEGTISDTYVVTIKTVILPSAVGEVVRL